MKRRRDHLHLIAAVFTAIIFLLLVCCIIKILYTRPPRQRFIDVIIFTEWQEKMFHEIYKQPYTAIRHYQDIHFTGDKGTDNIKLSFARVRIREIIQQQDTLNGIHFSYGKHTTFSHLIQTLDILRQERAQRYIVDNGEIWFIEQATE